MSVSCIVITALVLGSFSHVHALSEVDVVTGIDTSNGVHKSTRELQNAVLFSANARRAARSQLAQRRPLTTAEDVRQGRQRRHLLQDCSSLEQDFSNCKQCLPSACVGCITDCVTMDPFGCLTNCAYCGVSVVQDIKSSGCQKCKQCILCKGFSTSCSASTSSTNTSPTSPTTPATTSSTSSSQSPSPSPQAFVQSAPPSPPPSASHTSNNHIAKVRAKVNPRYYARAPGMVSDNARSQRCTLRVLLTYLQVFRALGVIVTAAFIIVV